MIITNILLQLISSPVSVSLPSFLLSFLISFDCNIYSLLGYFTFKVFIARYILIAILFIVLSCFCSSFPFFLCSHICCYIWTSLPINVCLVKAMVFPVVMYGCESWPIKKLSAEELMLLNCGVGQDSWESLGLQGDPTQCILKEISPECSLEGLTLKLSSNTLATWWEEPFAKTRCWERWKQEEKGTTEDDVVVWHHRLNGYEFG